MPMSHGKKHQTCFPPGFASGWLGALPLAKGVSLSAAVSAHLCPMVIHVDSQYPRGHGIIVNPLQSSPL